MGTYARRARRSDEVLADALPMLSAESTAAEIVGIATRVAGATRSTGDDRAVLLLRRDPTPH